MKAMLLKLGRVLWPFVTRRRFREAVQLAERLRLGRRALAADKVALANTNRELTAQLAAADFANRNLIRNNAALARLVNQALNAIPKPPADGDDGWDSVVAAGLGKPAVPVLLPGQRADLGDIEQEKRYHDGLGDQ